MATKKATQAIIVREQSPIRRRASAIGRRVGAAAKKGAARAGKAAAKRAWERRAMMGAVGAGYLMGYIQKNNIDFPTVPALGKNGTIAAALFAASMFVRNEWLNHLAAGAAAVAAYDYGTTGSVHGVGNAGGGGRYGGIHAVIDQSR